MSHPTIKGRDARIESISFRDKRLGWKKYSFALTLSVPDGHGAKNTVLHSEPLDKNIFMRGFLTDLYLRPSCHACPAKCFKSGSDITIGDFWGIERVMPEIDDDKGVSVVFAHHDEKLDLCNLEKIKIESYTQYSVEKSSEKKIGRGLFFSSFEKRGMLRSTYCLVSIYQFRYDVRRLIVRILKRIGLFEHLKKIMK